MSKTIKKILAIVTLTCMLFACDPNPGDTYAYSKPATFQTMASAAGWPLSQQPRIKCLINRESGWNPKAYNGRDPGYGSFGWLQVNMSKGSYGTWTFYKAALGYNIYNLFNPRVNLVIARDLFLRSGRMFGDPWKPWRPLTGC